MRSTPLVRLTLLFLGLAALFTGLNLAARGRLATAAVTSGAGAAAAGVAAWLLIRSEGERPGRRSDPGAPSGETEVRR